MGNAYDSRTDDGVYHLIGGNVQGGSNISVTNTCRYCGSWHQGVCARIEEIEYFANGTIKRVKLREPHKPKG